uniref:Uncharacterized protein n=1 Tax=Pipistrellus kuhlii TaxID=59472 RepID=A0A7J8A7M8_PIPKU|nr:hypothetical protein mPipKuh1_008798 [Pipistrellus kuhlii]
MPDSPGSPCMTSEPLSGAGAQRKQNYVSSCAGTLRGIPGTPAASVSLSHNPHWFLQPEVMGNYLPSSGTLGWGSGVGLASLLLTGGLGDILPHSRYTTRGCWASPFCASTPPTSLNALSSFLL